MTVVPDRSAFLQKRDVAQRLVIRGELELTSPAHLGCGRGDEESDQPVLTDQDGQPYLPGTTLAGLLRHQLSRSEAESLFGPESQSDKDDIEQSRLLFCDCPLIGDCFTELREGVSLDGRTSVAKDMTKYDFELLGLGTKFEVRLELLLPIDPKQASVLRSLTGRLLAQLEDGQVRLGARSQRGFGDCRIVANAQGARWRVEKYDLTALDGLMAWMGLGTPEIVSIESGRAWAKDTVSVAEDFQITLKLRVHGGVLIGSGGHGADEADKSHLHRQTGGGKVEPVLSGTSLAGVLRHRCQKILHTLDKHSLLVGGLFGSKDSASKVRVWEVPIRDGQTLRHSRVRIDPWTGGAAETALFTQDVHYGGRVEVRLSVRDSKPEERALLLLALRDLAEGLLRVGGQTGAGRGRLAPEADGRFATITSQEPPVTLSFESGRVTLEPENAFAEDFHALRSLP